MAIQVRKGTSAVELAIISSLNALRAVAAATWNVVHADVTSMTNGDFQTPASVPAVFIAPLATDLPSLLRLCAEIGGRHAIHTRDALAHRGVDAADALTNPASPGTLAAAQAFLTDAKVKWNAHLTQAGVHYANDTADAITVPDATDQASAIVLANAYRAAFNAHIQNALFGASIALIDP